ERLFDQRAVIALHVEDLAAVIGVRRRIEHAQLPAPRAGAIEKLLDVRSNELAGNAVELQVVAGPVEIVLRRVHGRRRTRSTAQGRHREAVRVGEEIEKRLSLRFLPYPRASLAVIREEPRVDEVVEVDEELQVVFAHFDPLPAARQPLVLLAGAALFQMDALP